MVGEIDIEIGISPLGHALRDLVYGWGDEPCVLSWVIVLD